MFLDEILEGLKPFEYKVFICPLNEEDINIIQSNFDKKIPSYFIEFLRKIGLKQDFVWELLDKMQDFERLDEFLDSDDYFRIGDNGGEDYWLLKFDETDHFIYEYNYYSTFEILNLGFTFEQLLEKSLERIKSNEINLAQNIEKKWSVSFSIFCEQELCFETILGKFISISKLGDLKYNKEKSKNKQHLIAELEIEGHSTFLEKLIFTGGRKPLLFFNFSEPVLAMKENSSIKKIESALLYNNIEYVLVDYGITNTNKTLLLRDL